MKGYFHAKAITNRTECADGNSQMIFGHKIDLQPMQLIAIEMYVHLNEKLNCTVKNESEMKPHFGKIIRNVRINLSNKLNEMKSILNVGSRSWILCRTESMHT